jgi:phosphocarrier protein HPr
MLRQEAIVGYSTGLHLRPARIIMMEARKFNSTITIEYNNRHADGKSIISLLQLGAGHGVEVSVRVEGADEARAMRPVIELIQSS